MATFSVTIIQIAIKMFRHLFGIQQPFLLKNITVNTKFLLKKISNNFSKITNQQPPHQSPPSTSQDPPTTPTNIQVNNAQSSTRISFQDNLYTFEERHARLSEPLELVIRHAPLSEPHYEPVYNIYPPSPTRS